MVGPPSPWGSAHAFLGCFLGRTGNESGAGFFYAERPAMRPASSVREMCMLHQVTSARRATRRARMSSAQRRLVLAGAAGRMGLEPLEGRLLFALSGSPFESNDGNLVV